MQTINSLLNLGSKPWQKILIIMPHPDDETVFCAGLIQQVVKLHIPLKIITMTVGEASTLRYTLKSTDNLATVRETELITALATLGCSDYEILKFADGNLSDAIVPMKLTIQKYLDSYQPSHVVTLEPDGIYGHPDHIALSQAVTESITNQTLIYATVTPNYVLPSAKHMAKKIVIKPIKPDYKLSLTFTEAFTKIKSLRCHRSQFRINPLHLDSVLFFTYNDMFLHEFYALKT